MLLKLDFHKAYDSVRWEVVDHTLERMGVQWKKWINSFLTSASMSILVNVSPTKPFKMKRGLHQRDPLSLFLVILVAEVLNKMVSSVVDLGIIESIKVGKDQVLLSHLHCTDNTIISYPTKEEVLLNYK